VSLREALLDWWEDVCSILLIKRDNFFCTVKADFSAIWVCADVFNPGWPWDGDHGCDEASSAGSYDQIKVVRQSYVRVFVFNFVNPLDANNPVTADPCQIPKEKLRNL